MTPRSYVGRARARIYVRTYAEHPITSSLFQKKRINHPAELAETTASSNVRKRILESDKDESGGLRDKTNVSEILARAKVSLFDVFPTRPNDLILSTYILW